MGKAKEFCRGAVMGIVCGVFLWLIVQVLSW